MPLSSKANTQRTARVLMIALALLFIAVPALRSAKAASLGGDSMPASTTPPATADLPVIGASLVASETAVPAGGVFGYSTDIRLAQPTSYLEVQLSIHRPNGRLVYLRTQVDNDIPSGVKRFSFERELAGLELTPGAYPLDVAVRASVSGSTVTTDIAAQLLVYDPAAAPLPVVLVARVYGQPLSGPAGAFMLDPAVATRARDEVDRISMLVTTDPAVHMTLGVPPVLLAEWRRISGGYTTSDGLRIPASNPVALSYGTTLDHLKAAMHTGRLELVSLGYSDPDLNDLADQGLSSDTSPQYDAGLSAVFASLEATSSTGTVPAGGCVPPGAIKLLAEKGVSYIVADASCGRRAGAVAVSGAYRIAGSPLRALLVDTAASKDLSSSEPSTALHAAFNRLDLDDRQPYVLRIDLDEATADATTTVGVAVKALEAAPWIHMLTARDAVTGATQPDVRLVAGGPAPVAPDGFWDDVAQARAYSSAMIASLGSSDAGAMTSQTQSLVAESSAWSGPNGTWQFADRGRAYALASLQTTRAILDTVHIKVEPITLSGAKGDVPVSVLNGTQRTLNVVVRTTTNGGIKVNGARDMPLTLRPQETFLQIPVDLESSLSGKLTVEVVAGNLVLSRKTVDVKASYLDRLAVIGGIVLLLAILLAFIVRRVRAAEATATTEDGSGAAPQSARYTEAGEVGAEPREENDEL